MSYTVAAVRRLVNIDAAIVSDEFIQGYADDGFIAAIDVAIALADYMATLSTSATRDIKVGPISIAKAEQSQNWQAIKDNLIKRKLTGSGVADGGLGLSSLTYPVDATLTGGGDPQAFIGQFDNPPETATDE